MACDLNTFVKVFPDYTKFALLAFLYCLNLKIGLVHLSIASILTQCVLNLTQLLSISILFSLEAICQGRYYQLCVNGKAQLSSPAL